MVDFLRCARAEARKLKLVSRVLRPEKVSVKVSVSVAQTRDRMALPLKGAGGGPHFLTFSSPPPAGCKPNGAHSPGQATRGSGTLGMFVR